MTRKRTRESLEELLTDSCPHCEGRRVVKSVPTLAAEVLRGVHREARRSSGDDMLLVKVHPAVARYLYDHGARDLEALERRVGIKIVLRAMEGLEPGSFEAEPGARRRLTEESARPDFARCLRSRRLTADLDHRSR